MIKKDNLEDQLQQPMKNKIITQLYESPCGEMIIGSLNGKLCLCDWTTGRIRHNINKRLQKAFDAKFEIGSSPVISRTIEQLNEYFAGKRQKFTIPLQLAGTDFQKAVWQELMEIPYGKTISYSELANKTGDPKAVRAVANANKNNAISILVPCHRVIGKDGSLTGYGGGMAAKQYLIELEKRETLIL